MTLQWNHVNFNARELRLPDSKTGAKTVHLGTAALDKLETIEKLDDNEFVITGKSPGAYLTDLQHPWRRIRKIAKLDDVRLHDLRHSFASHSLVVDEGLPMIGKLLGHTQIQTTARYAHLANDPIKTAADRISGGISESSGDREVMNFSVKTAFGWPNISVDSPSSYHLPQWQLAERKKQI